MKRTLSLVLSLLMVVSVFTFAPFTVNAAEDNTAEVGAELAISLQPKDAYITSENVSGQDVTTYPTLHIAVTGGSYSYTYYWYYSNAANSNSSTPIKSGANESNCIANNAGYYYCVIKDSAGAKVKSNTVEVTQTAVFQPVNYRFNGSKIEWGASPNELEYKNVTYRMDMWYSEENYFSKFTVSINRTSSNSFTYGVKFGDYDYTELYPVTYDSNNNIYSLDINEFIKDKNAFYIFCITASKYGIVDLDRAEKTIINFEDMNNGNVSGKQYDGEVQIEKKEYNAYDVLFANVNGGRWSGNGNVLTYIFQRQQGSDWIELQNSTQNYYRATPDDVGKRIRVVAKPTNTINYQNELYFDTDTFVSNDVSVTKKDIPVDEFVYATITKPVVGKVADFSLDLSGNNYCIADTATIAGTGLEFFNVTEGQPVNIGQTFKPNTTYKANIYLRINKTDPISNYIFSEYSQVYINNTLATIEPTYNKQVLRATMEFKTSEQKYVTVSFDANGGSGTMAPREARKGYSYTLPNCEFTAPAGKRFDCWLVNGERIRASKSFVANADTTAVAQWVDAPATINNIEIYLDKTPTADSLPCINASAPSGAGYYVYVDYKQPFYNNGVRWWGKTENRNLDPTTDRFVEGREYTVDICILTQDGFEFDVSSLTATLNGEQAIIPTDGGIYATANGAHVTYKFICTASELEAIPRIDVTVTAPKAGESPDFNVILPDDADYHIDAKYGVRWDIAATDVFTAGEQYNLWFYVIPDDGFYFDPDDDVIISVNGDEYEKNITSSTKFKTQVMYQFTAMGAAMIGDVNGDKNVDVLDAAIVQKYAAGKSTLTPEQIYAGDVNGDNNADVLDAALIQKFAAGKITGFPKKA